MDRPPFDTIHYRSPVVTIASFRAEPAHSGFHDSGPAENHIFVFPRTSIRIRHAGCRPFVAGPNVVTFYNRGQVYFRERVTEEGDRCEWFAVAPEVLAEVVGRYDPAAADRPEAPFRFTHGPGDASTYLVQRLLVRSLAAAERGALADPLFAEESAVRLLARTVAGAARTWDLPGRAPERRPGDLPETAKLLLARDLRAPLPLDELARRAGTSVYHLCRTFRRHTGTTLHAWRTQLRLRTALEGVAEPGTDLTDLALDLGYSSHSHFTAAFRQAFGMAPSVFRRQANARAVRELAAWLAPAVANT